MKDINLNPKILLAKLIAIENKVHRYFIVIFIILVLGVYGFLVFAISQAAQKEPSADQLSGGNEKLTKLKVNQNAVNTMKSLEDQNVTVKSLFEQARTNPFNE